MINSYVISSKRVLLALALLCVNSVVNATTFNVTNTNDSGPGSLREAILSANLDNAGAPHTINLTGLSGVILLNDALPDIKLSTTINGPVDNSLVISRDVNTSTFSILNIKPIGASTISVVLNNLVVTNGSSLTGGGIYVENSNLTINRCRVTNNFVNNGLGGGICTNNANVIINSSTIDGNYNLAGLGGGIYMNFGSLQMTNSTVYGNRAAIGGGLDKATLGTVVINNCTFANDTADDQAGAIYINIGNVELNNTLVAANIGNNGAPAVFGTIFSTNGHNLLDDSQGATFTGTTTGNILGLQSNTVIDNQLKNNGGVTPTVLLLACSPAIDAGTSAGAPSDDQRGIVRAGQGTNFDIGAVEYSGPIVQNQLVCGSATISIIAIGGTNYNWYDAPGGNLLSGGSDTFNPTVSSDTTFYVVDISSNCESPVIIPVNIQQFADLVPPTISAGSPTTFCSGNSVVLTASEMVNDVTYAWSPNGGTDSLATVLTSGNYSVTVTDANGCSGTSNSINVTVNPSPVPVITPNGSTTICQGSSVELSSNFVSGNVWSTGETSQTITVNSTQTITLTVTDANGCIGTSNPLTVTQLPSLPPPPVITSSGPLDICQGSSVVLTSSYTSGNVWSPGNQTTQDITVNQAGTFSVTFTDANGCSSVSQPITVNILSLPVAPVVTASGSTTFCQGGSVQLSANPASGNLTWLPGNISGASLNVTDAGAYNVVVTDLNGCTAISNTTNVTVNNNPTQPAITIFGGSANVCSGQSVTLFSSSPTGNTWNPGGSTQSSLVVNSAGSYTVTVTDINGCSSTSDPAVINTLPLPIAPVISANGPTTICNGSSVQLSSDILNNIVWSNNSTSAAINVNTSGSFSAVFTDANGCTAQSNIINVVVNTPTPATITGNNQFCSGGNTTLTASAGNSFQWVPGGETLQSINVSSSGIYSVIVTDGNNCTSLSTPFLVTEFISTPVTINPAGSIQICSNNPLTLTSSSANSNSWSPTGETSQTITVSNSGNYFVTVTDVNGCTQVSNTVNVDVLQAPTQPIINPAGPISSCGGSVLLDAGVIPGVTYLWSDNTTNTQTNNVTTSGSYAVTVTNALGCSSSSIPVQVDIQTTPVIDLGADVVQCGGTVTFDAGNSGSTYLWSNGETTQSITLSSSLSNLSVQVTNSCGVITSNSVSATINSIPQPTVSPSGPLNLCSGNSILLTSDIASGIIWFPTNETTQDITVSNSGNYFVTVIDNNGCSGVSNTVFVNNDTPIGPVNIGSDVVQCGGTVTLTAPIIPGATYLWSDGQTIPAITVSTSGSYNVQVTNSCGTELSNTVNLTINPLPNTPTIIPGSAVTFCQGSSVVLTSSEPNGNAWSNGQTGNSIVVSETGNITVTVTDANGCTATSLPVQVTQDFPLAAPNLGGPYIQCAGLVTLDAIVSGGSTTYLWSTGATSQTIDVNLSGSYSVIATNSCGSVQSTIAQVTINSNPPAPVITTSGPTTFCEGGSITLTSDITNNIVWNTGETTPSIQVNQTGSYFVTFSDGNNCTSVSTSVIVNVQTLPIATNLGGPFTQCGGIVTLDAQNAQSGVIYLWNNGATDQTLTISQSGTFFVTIANSCGTVQSSAAIVDIQIPPTTPVITTVGPAAVCSPSVVELVSDLQPNYFWSDGQTSQNIFVSQSGNYSVTVIAGNGCSATSNFVTVDIQNPPIATDFGGPVVQCGGDITLDAGNPGASYLWSNGETTQTILVTQSGNYSVQITNSCGTVQSSTADISIINPPNAPTITANGPTTFCNGGSVDLSSNSGIGNVWSTGETTQTITVDATGTFTVTVTDANGCSATSAPITVTEDQPLVAPDLGGPFIQCLGTVTLDAGNANTGITSYLWSPTGETTQTIDAGTSGNYSVVLSNTCGSVTSTVAQVTINPLPVVTITANGPTTFCNGGSVDLSSNSGIGNVWSTGETTQTITVDATGTFTVTVTDVNGCSATSAPITVTEDQPLVAPNLGGPFIQCLGTVTLDAGNANTGITSYLWSPTGETTQTIDAGTSGNYSVVLSNTCGSVTSTVAQVTINPLPVVTITANGPTTFCNGGTVDLSSNSGIGNVWSTGETTQTITVDATGTFTVTVTDANGCSATSAPITVTEDQPLVAPDLGGPFIQCLGTVTLDAGNANTGITSYLWSPTGETTQTIDAGTSGNYSVVLSNTCGSVTSTVAQVTINPLPVVTITANGPTTFCNGGSVDLSSNSGIGNVWSTGETTQTITVDATGTFTVTVTDVNGCSATSAPITVTEDQPLVAPNLGGPFIQCLGTVTLDAGNANTGITSYLWSPTGETTQTIDAGTSGNYSVVLSNTCGSVTSTVAQVTINPLPVVTITANGPTTFCNGGTVDLSSNSGIGNVWSTGETTQTITVDATGTFTVTVTDANGCSATSAPITVTEDQPLVAPNLGGPFIQCLGTVTLDAGNANTGITSYLWSPTGETTQTIDAGTSGNYSVVLSNTCGSVTSTVAQVTINPLPVVTITANGPTTFCNGGTVDLSSNSGIGNVWSTGETTQTITVDATGTFTVTVTDANGCSATSAPITVTEDQPLVAPDLGGPFIQCLGTVTLDAGNANTGITSYLWSPTGETTQTIDAGTSGNYSVVLSNTCGSVTSTVAQVTINPLPVVTITANGPTTFCNGGSVDLSSNSGIGNVWSTGETTQTITVDATGTFTVTVTDANGCSATSAPITVTEDQPLVAPDLGGPFIQCLGTVTLDAGNANTGITSYLWSPTGETTQTIDAGTSGNYSVVLSNTCGSVTSTVAQVTINPLPVVTITANGPTTFCNGGSVDLSSNSGIGNVWSTGETTQTITVDATGTFTVTVTDANGCSATSAPITVTEDQPLVAPDLGGPFIQCLGTVTLDAGNANTGITSYLWSPTGETTQTIDAGTSGNYSVVLSNTCGSVTSTVAQVTINPLPVVTITANGPTTFCNGGSVDLSSNSGIGNVWSTGETTQTITVDATGTFTVTVTDANGCSATSAPITVTEDQPLVAPNLGGPFIQCIGTVTLDAGNANTGITSYLWSPTGETTQTIDAGTSGNYSVVLSNTCGSVTSTVAQVTINPLPVVTITANGPTTFCNGGSVDLSSNSGIGNVWSTGETTQNITVDATGTFTVTVTDVNGCSATSAPITVTEDQPLVAPNLGGPFIQCLGTVTLDAGNANTGITSYLWSPTGETTQTIDAGTSGNYSVVLSNTCGSVTSTVAQVTINPLPVVTITANGPTTFCNGGTVDLSSNSGIGNVWSTGETTQTITVDATGTFTVTVTDANGCSATSAPITVTEDQPLVAPDLGGPFIQCLGTVTLDAGNANTGITSYLWSPTGETTQTIDAGTSGNYSVVLSNTCGSVTSTVAQVTINPLPVVTITANGPTTFCNGGSVDLSSNSGIGNVWSTGETTQTITVDATGTFTVTVTDANGCSATSAPITVTEDQPLVAPDLGGPFIQCLGTVTLDAGNANTGITSYLWSPTGETTQTIDAGTSGNYSVVLSNTCGSVTSTVAQVTINPLPVVTITANGPTTFCNGGSVDLSSNSGIGNVWSTGETTQTITVDATGTFTVTVTDANGCSATSAPITVTEDQPLVAPNLGGPFIQCLGTVTLDAGNANTGITSYLWSPTGETTQTIDAGTSGNYSVVLSNTCGSVTSTVAQVTINPLPVVTITANGPTTFCNGGTVDLSSNSGIGNVWSTGETTQTITVDATGTFTVTVTDANGCSATSAPITVTEDQPLVAPDLGGPFIQCLGTVTLDAGNANTGITSYLWSPTGETTQTIDAGTSGNYSVVLSNTCGSVTSTVAQVTINPLPVVTITANGPTTFCNGGSVDLSSNSGIGNVWSTGETTQTITVDATGTFTVTVTDVNGCSATSAPITVTEDQPLVAPDLGGPYTQCGGTVTLDAGNANTGITSYLWSPTGETTQTIDAGTSGNYSVVLSNTCGSVTSTVAQVTINPIPAIPTITASGPVTFCAGGSVDLSSSSASDNVWSTGETTQTITVDATGTFTVTVTDVNGCSATSAPITVTEDQPLVAPDLGGPYTQCGGTVTLDAGNANTGITSYLWSPTGETTQTIDAGTSGNYSVVLSNTCGSVTSTVAQVTINPIPAIPTITASGPVTFCAGGSVDLSSSSASDNVWSTGETTQTITVDATGTFTVTVTDVNGCSATSAPITVTEDQPLVAPDLGGPFIQCLGTVTLDAGNANTGITSYLWSPTGETTQTIDAGTSGNYSVVLSNTCGSVTSTVAQVTINPLPVVTITANGPTTFCNGGTVDLSSNSGIGNVWSTGETTQTITVDATGTFIVTVTDVNGCSATSAPITVTEDQPLVAPDLGGPFIQCLGTVTLDAGNANTGITSYLWSPTGETTQTIDAGTSGNYSVVLSNTCGSVTSTVAQVTINPLPVVTITANGPTTFCNGGTVDLSSNSGIGNVWSTGETTQTITVDATGTFTVTVTDVNGCSATSAPITVTEDQPLVAPDLGGPYTQCGGTVTLDAGNANTGITSYLWSPTGETTQTIDAGTSGNYSVVLSNTCGSVTSTVAQVTINPIPAIPTITASGPVTFCAGGSVDLSSSSASDNVWSTGETTQTITVDATGTFTVTVTDANGCSATSAPITVTEDQPLVAPDLGGPFIQCLGTVTLDAGNANTGITSYLWSPTGETTQTIDAGTSGNYSVVLSNTCGSVTSTVAQVTINPLPVVTITANGPTTFCNGGSVDLSSNSGIGNVWSTGETTQTITVDATGTFTVTVTDANGCSATSAPITVTEDQPLVAPNLGGPFIQCIGTVTLDAGNANTGITSYLWSPTGETTQTIDAGTSGNYSVVLSNTCGSVTSTVAQVTINPLPVVTITANGPTTFCNGGSVDLSSNSGIGNVWSTGETTQTITVDATGTFTVTVTDVNGCSATSAPITVTEDQPLVAPNLGGPYTQCGGTVTLDAGNANTGITSYLWSPTGETTQTIDAGTSGNYSVVLSNTCGSVTSTVAQVTINTAAQAQITAGGATTLCSGDSLNLSASAGVSFVWSPSGETSASIFVNQTGSYSVTVTDINGCTSTSLPISITVLPASGTAQINASGPTTFCLGESVVLTSNSPIGNLWNNGSNQSALTVFSAGTYILTVSGTNGCIVGTDTVIVNTLFNPTAVITLSNSPQLCEGDSLTLFVNTNDAYEWAFVNSDLTLTPIASTQSITIDSAAIYTVTVTGSNGCTSTAQSVQVLNAPAATKPTISIDGQLICGGGGSVELTASGSVNYLWNNGDTGPLTIINQMGSYWVEGRNIFGCKATSDTVFIPRGESALTLKLEPTVYDNGFWNLTCANGSDGKITALPSDGTEPYSFNWSTGSTHQVISGLKGGADNVYSVIVTDAFGCTIQDTITLRQPPGVLDNMPQGFSPDGNGVNDNFVIPGIKAYETNNVIIFNRWGNEVFNSEGSYLNNWDGSGPNGELLPEGTYFVVFTAESQVCGKIDEHRWVELRRK